jgi:hypothetical protein
MSTSSLDAWGRLDSRTAARAGFDEFRAAREVPSHARHGESAEVEVRIIPSEAVSDWPVPSVGVARISIADMRAATPYKYDPVFELLPARTVSGSPLSAQVFPIGGLLQGKRQREPAGTAPTVGFALDDCTMWCTADVTDFAGSWRRSLRPQTAAWRSPELSGAHQADCTQRRGPIGISRSRARGLGTWAAITDAARPASERGA